MNEKLEMVNKILYHIEKACIHMVCKCDKRFKLDDDGYLCFEHDDGCQVSAYAGLRDARYFCLELRKAVKGKKKKGKA